jgi:F-type H+-transporting ATPase subunit gamma
MLSMMSQKPEIRKLIPIEAGALGAAPTAAAAASRGDENEPGPSMVATSRGAIEFSPSPEFVLSRLLPKYLEFTIYSAMLETDAAFFAAQLVAMSNATDNATKLVDELTIQMNNARQAAITKELLEIVAGAEALGVE